MNEPVTYEHLRAENDYLRQELRLAQDLGRRRSRYALLRADVGEALARKTELHGMLQGCAEAVVRHMGAAFARVWTYEEAESVLVLQASAGMYTHLAGAHSRIPVGRLKIGRIAERREPVLTNDVLNDPRISDPDWARREGMVSFAGYPLVVEDRVVGVLAMFARRPMEEDELEAFAAIADALAQGIERKRTELALASSEQRFRAIFEQSSLGIALVGADGRYVETNPVYQRMLGYSGDELRSLEMMQLTHESDRASNRAVLDELFAGTQDVARLEKRYVRKDGTILWARVRITLIWNATHDKQYILRMAEDITAERQAETELSERTHELQAANAKLIQADRYKDEFLSVLSHELRTPLNAIMGFGSILEDEVAGPLSDTQHEYLDKLLRGASTLLALINDLLDMSRMAAGKFQIEPQPMQLPLSVSAVLDALRPLADLKRLTIDAELPGDLPCVTADAQRIGQVLTNLVGNAIKFTPEGGRVRIGARIDGDSLRCEVTDTGVGLAADDLPKLFKRFGQLDGSSTRKAGGTGLGLSISKGLMEAHGGSIGAWSEGLGRGATFWFTLPLSPNGGPGLPGGGRPGQGEGGSPGG